MMRRTILAILLAVVLAPVAHGQKPPVVDEDNDGLPGASRSPSRKDIEVMIRGVGRDPVTPELVDRVDALFRPRWTRPKGFEGAKRWLADPAFVATIDEVAREATGKPADARMLICCATRNFNFPDKDSHRSRFRTELARETGAKMKIMGQVVDEEEGKPLAGVVISGSEVLTRTNGKGEYLLTIPRPKPGEEITLSFEALGRALGQTYFLWKEEIPETETRDFRLPKAVRFTGRVIDPDGKPIAGVFLEVSVPAVASSRDGSEKVGMHANFHNMLEAHTDDKGRYAFRNIPPDLPDGRPAVSRLTVTHPRYVAKSKDYAGNELLGPGWEITLEPGSIVAGVVADAAGKPISGASISAHSGAWSGEEPSVTSDKAGKFRFENLAEGAYTLVVRSPEHAMALIPVDAKKNAPADLKVTPEAGVYFEGKVIGEDGKPAKNASVGWIQPIDDQGRPITPEFYLGKFSHTKEDGTFRVGPVAKGRKYKVTGLVDPPRAVAVVQAETDGKPLLLELKPDRR